MKFTIGYKGGTELKLGHKVLRHAADIFRKRKREVFEASVSFLLTQPNSPSLQDAILAGEKEFWISQIPSDAEVGEFLTTCEGRRVAIQGALASEKLTEEQADDILDQMSDEDFQAFTIAIEGLRLGSKLSQLNQQRSRILLEEAELSVERARADVDLQRRLLEKLKSSVPSDTNWLDDEQTPPAPETLAGTSAPDDESAVDTSDTVPTSAG